MLCGPFVRSLLDKNQTVRLSKPALETLAIVAYRQPCLRSEIEEVLGIMDAVLRKLVKCSLYVWSDGVNYLEIGYLVPPKNS